MIHNDFIGSLHDAFSNILCDNEMPETIIFSERQLLSGAKVIAVAPLPTDSPIR